MKNVERNLLGLIVVAALAVGAGWMVTGCGDEANGFVGQPAPCDVCLHATPDAGDAQ